MRRIGSEPIHADRLKVTFDEGKIDRIFSEVDRCHTPGAAVGIALNGRPIYRKGFGLANLELPVILTPATRLRIGSTSKHFTCLAYLLLCEEGRADPDDPIRKYLPELHPVTHGVTVRQLMANVSGLRDAYEIFFHFSDHYARNGGPAAFVASEELIRLYCEMDDVNALPGTTWIYNNGGWLILTVIIEKITGQSLEQVMSERIFERIGMHDTLLLRSDVVFVPNRGGQHVSTSVGAYEKLGWGAENFVGAGAVISTVDDMLRWLAHMSAPVVGNAATWRAMQTSQRLLNGVSTGYGFGLFIERYRGAQTIHHAGGAFGGNAQMLKVPAAGLDVVVLVNRRDVDGMALTNQILDACLPELEPIRPSAAADLAQGIFRSALTGRVVQLSERDGGQIVSINGTEISAEPDKDGVLWPSGTKNVWRQGVTLLGDRQMPHAIQFSDYGNLDELRRVPSAPHPTAGIVAGIYRSQATGTEARVVLTCDGACLKTSTPFGSATFRLVALSPGVARAKPETSKAGLPGGIVCFDPEGTGFQFLSATLAALPFRRCE